MKPAIRRADVSAEYYTDERCDILELSNSAGDPDASMERRGRVEVGGRGAGLLREDQRAVTARTGATAARSSSARASSSGSGLLKK